MSPPSAEAEKTLYAVIGHVTVHWAYVEINLDFLVAISYRHCGGNSIDLVVPVSLNRKIKFLRKSFRTLPKFEPFKDNGLVLLDRISTLKNKRHDYVHGVVMAHGNPIEMLRTTVEDQWHTSVSHEVTLEDMSAFGQEVVVLAVDLIGFANDLVKRVFTQAFDQ